MRDGAVEQVMAEAFPRNTVGDEGRRPQIRFSFGKIE